MSGKTRATEVLRRLLLCFVGAAAGALLIPLFSQEDRNRLALENMTGFGLSKTYYPVQGLFPVAIYVIVTMLAILILEKLIYHLGNSKRKKRMEVAMCTGTCLLAGLPLTLLLFLKLERFRPLFRVDLEMQFFLVMLAVGSSLLDSGDKKFIKRILIGVLSYMLGNMVIFLIRLQLAEGTSVFYDENIYYINNVFGFLLVFVIAERALESSLHQMLKKPYSRYRLSVYQVKTATQCFEKEVVIERQPFEKCYTAMPLNREKVSHAQFFKILETNHSGKRIVDSWNYDGDGQILNMTDEEICRYYISSFMPGYEHADNF